MCDSVCVAWETDNNNLSNQTAILVKWCDFSLNVTHMYFNFKIFELGCKSSDKYLHLLKALKLVFRNKNTKPLLQVNMSDTILFSCSQLMLFNYIPHQFLRTLCHCLNLSLYRMVPSLMVWNKEDLSAGQHCHKEKSTAQRCWRCHILFYTKFVSHLIYRELMEMMLECLHTSLEFHFLTLPFLNRQPLHNIQTIIILIRPVMLF